MEAKEKVKTAHKWSAAQHKKFSATMKAKRLNGDLNGAKPHAKIARDDVRHDAIIYLRHSREDVMKRLRTGRLKELDRAHLLAFLALQTLEGSR